MPTFILNKLVRDKLVDDFERMNQKASYRSLTREEHVEALKSKIIEEVKEIPADGETEDLVTELADLQQVLDDLKVLMNVTDEQVDDVQWHKYDKKGGFLAGRYVTSIELQDDDPWLAYYRDHPELFPETPTE
jgi:predicted house-cleaning noncanonical NTP pyrophosphatase (MazG superfamily)